MFSPRYLLPIQIPTNTPGKAAEDGPITWTSVTPVEDLDGTPGSWLQHGTLLTIVTIWGVKQQTGELFVTASPFLSPCLLSKYNTFLKESQTYVIFQNKFE